MFAADSTEFKEGIIQSVSQPRVDMKVPSGLVVDVSVSFDGNQSTYVFLGDAETAQMGYTTFSYDMAKILEAVKAARMKYQEIVDGYETAKDKVVKCESLLKQFDPELKRAVADAARWNEMDARMREMEAKQNAFMAQLGEKINKFVEAMEAKPSQTTPKKAQQSNTLL